MMDSPRSGWFRSPSKLSLLTVSEAAKERSAAKGRKVTHGSDRVASVSMPSGEVIDATLQVLPLSRPINSQRVSDM